MLVGILILSALIVAIVAAFFVVTHMRDENPETHYKDLRRLADVRGWHFTRPDNKEDGYGLSGETMVTGSDGSSMDWRVQWFIQTRKTAQKSRTELKCVDVPLPKGWAFVDPRAEAQAVRARQRVFATSEGGVRRATWKEEQAIAKEMPVGTPEFHTKFMVTATAKESVVRRLMSQRVQKAMLELKTADSLSVRIGTEGITIVTSAVFQAAAVEQLMRLGDMIVANVAQEVLPTSSR